MYCYDKIAVMQFQQIACANVSHDERSTVDLYGRVTSATRDGIEDVVFYDPTNGTIAAISNAEVCVTYAYTSDLLDAGCELAIADGVSFSRDVRRNSLYFRENVYAVTNRSPAATNEFRYSFDVLNRPVSRNADAFAYNARGEVADAAMGTNVASYVYDGIGNAMTSAWNGVATTYSANALNQYESIASGGVSSWLQYSANGELTRLGSRGFLYDTKSRLVAAGEWVFDEERYLAGDYDNYDELYSFEPTVSNRYDHLDRRVQKITPEATHTYFYDAFGKLIASSGPMANVFAIRYSTKYFDPESAGMLTRTP